MKSTHKKPRYVFGLWTHIFHANGPDITVRFCFDTEQGKLTHMDIQRKCKWVAANRQEMDDLEDSLKNANPEALDDPEEAGLEQSDSLPDFFSGVEIAPAKKLKRVVVVVTFEDPDDDIIHIADAALWVESSLSRKDRFIDVTTYSTAADAAADEKDGAGDFTEQATPVPGLT